MLICSDRIRAACGLKPLTLAKLLRATRKNPPLSKVLIVGYWNCAPQECKALHFQATAVEMPNTDALPYLMYKSIRETLKELRLHLDKTLDRDLSRISDKGASHSSVPLTRSFTENGDLKILHLKFSSHFPEGNQQTERLGKGLG